MTKFIHLRLHSEFSINDSTISIDGAIKAAKHHNMPALAITDFNNGFAWVKFYQDARKNGIKPILGADVTVDNQQLLFLVQNNIGYLNMCQILSQVWQQQPTNIQLTELLAISQNLDGIIILHANPNSIIYSYLLNQNYVAAKLEAQNWQKIVGDRLYLEIQSNAHNHIIWPQLCQLAQDLQIPLVATHPIQFLQPQDFEAHEIRVCIAKGELLGDQTRSTKFNIDQYFKSSEEMQAMFKLLPSSLDNSIEIAKRCNLNLTLGQPQLPHFPTPDSSSLEDFLYQQSEQGLKKKFIQDKIVEQKHLQYKERLEFEVKTIINMGFAGYFLIVADFINWAKNNSIPVGPGRGSGAGSLVAYVLGITDIDPLIYNLIFERFLNPERISMPDFDIDFCPHGRDKVIQYVKNKYGLQAVSQIVTFGTMAAKAAIRDVGRVLDLGYNFVDGIAKLIPFKPTKHVTIKSALEEEPLLAKREQEEEEVKQLLHLAQKLEGLCRNVGMHAGGVLIAPNKLVDFCPLYTPDMINIVSQYDKDDVESIGLVKFDFLGLSTLTILDISQKHIHALFDANFNYQTIALSDKKTFSLLKQANTVAVFQLESRGMQSMLKDAGPDRFEDIIALISLYRPGPMDLIPSYIRRKHKKEEVIYPDMRVKDILQETYGIMVYQEQVMQMAQIIGGYTLGGADLLRRAMGKKKAEEMAEQRLIFRQGAEKQGLNTEKSDEIFDLMEKFAGYGFNKSHATAYALISYHTAFMKANYKECFMAANLTMAMDDSDKMAILIQDCKLNKIKICPPDINISNHEFIPIFSQNKESIYISYGLGAIKGLGQNAIEHILEQRKKGAFLSLFDFAQRIDKRILNKRALEALIKSGTFDCWGQNRGTLFANVQTALDISEQKLKQKNQFSLFDSNDQNSLPNLVEDDWDMLTTLKEEKSVLGYYFSGHLFDVYKNKYRHLINSKISTQQIGRDKTIVGIISHIRTQITSRGKILIIQLQDDSANIEATIFNDTSQNLDFYLKEDMCVVASGEIKLDQFSQNLRLNINKISTIEQANIKLAKHLRLYISHPPNIKAHEIINQLQTITIAKSNAESNNTKISVSVSIYYNNEQDDYKCKIILPENLRLPLNIDYLNFLDNINIKYSLV